MIRDNAVDLLMKRLGNRKDTSLRDDIINEMDFVQDNILQGGPFYPWFLLSEETYTTTTAGEHRLPLPTDFLHEWEDGTLYRKDTAATGATNPWIELTRDDWDILKNSYTTVAGGTPKYYDISANYFLLADTPDDAYEIWFRYYSKADNLAGSYGDANNVENGWLKYAPDWFMGEVGLIIAGQYLQSDTMVQIFATQATRGKKRLYDLDISMQESNKKRAMGDD